jgi:hypothetical protein
LVCFCFLSVDDFVFPTLRPPLLVKAMMDLVMTVIVVVMVMVHRNTTIPPSQSRASAMRRPFRAMN